MNRELKRSELSRATKFVEEIEAVCIKHNLTISHEDMHGAFVIEEFNPENIQWLRATLRWIALND